MAVSACRTVSRPWNASSARAKRLGIWSRMQTDVSSRPYRLPGISGSASLLTSSRVAYIAGAPDSVVRAETRGARRGDTRPSAYGTARAQRARWQREGIRFSAPSENRKAKRSFKQGAAQRTIGRKPNTAPLHAVDGRMRAVPIRMAGPRTEAAFPACAENSPAQGETPWSAGELPAVLP